MRNSKAMEDIVPVLQCTSEQFWSVYAEAEADGETDESAENGMASVVEKCERILRLEHDKYKLDGLLYGMLTEAPDPEGKRYVAVALRIAYSTRGEAGVVELAKVWMQNLFLPMFALSNMPYERDEQMSECIEQVVKREQYRCAITNQFDLTRGVALIQAGRPDKIPEGARCILEVAHIIPPMLSGYPKNRSNENGTSEEKDGMFWDLLQSWTGLEPSDFSIESIIWPTNGILLSDDDYFLLGEYMLYFDKDAYPESPNKYKVRLTAGGFGLSNRETSADVEFQARNGVEPPNPTFLRIHSSFAKVFDRSGAACYYYNLRTANEAHLPLDTEDVSALLTCKLSILHVAM